MAMIWLALAGMSVRVGLDVARYAALRARRRPGAYGVVRAQASRELQEHLLHPRHTRPVARGPVR